MAPLAQGLTKPMPLPAVVPVADHEVDPLAALMRETIVAVPYYNERAIAAELTKYSADTLRAMIADDPQSVLVARDGDALVGFCVSRFDDGTIWLSWFGTAAHARGRGVGAALLAALADTLPSRNAHKVWCDSRTDNTESASALEHADYKRIATLTNHWYEQDFFLWEWSARK